MEMDTDEDGSKDDEGCNTEEIIDSGGGIIE
jgi:hypothetical protein